MIIQGSKHLLRPKKCKKFSKLMKVNRSNENACKIKKIPREAIDQVKVKKII